MERHLAERRFFVAERFTIADIALYAYTHVADEGGFDLSGYPAVRHGSTGWRPSRDMCRYQLFPDRSVRQPDFQRPFPGLRIVVGEVEQAEFPGSFRPR